MMGPMGRIACFLCTLAMVACSGADDTAVQGVGGNIRMMKGHPTIRMVSENVRVKLPEATVRAVFVFHNDGPATTVKIGFPESGAATGTHNRRRTLFGYFRSYLDGQRLKVKREGSLDVDEDNSYHVWWTKSVHFGRYQTRVIVDEYQGGIGGDTSNHAFFTYVMSTGASWKGAIGKADITVDARGLGLVSDLAAAPEGDRRRGKVFHWLMDDIKPDEDDDIHLNWWDGWKDMWVNGKPVFTESKEWDVAGHEGNAPPKRTGNDIRLPVRAAASYLGCGVERIGRGRIKVSGDATDVTLRVGSRRLVSRGRVVYLHRPVWMHRDPNGESMMVELRPLVRALGGKSWWDKDGLHIKM